MTAGTEKRFWFLWSSKGIEFLDEGAASRISDQTFRKLAVQCRRTLRGPLAETSRIRGSDHELQALLRVLADVQVERPESAYRRLLLAEREVRTAVWADPGWRRLRVEDGRILELPRGTAR